jgi:hypothetical protein
LCGNFALPTAVPSPSHRDEQGAEEEEADVPGQRTPEVVAYMVNAEQLMVDEPFDDVENPPAS